MLEEKQESQNHHDAGVSLPVRQHASQSLLPLYVQRQNVGAWKASVNKGEGQPCSSEAIRKATADPHDYA
jgi:hypothetical protein